MNNIIWIGGMFHHLMFYLFRNFVANDDEPHKTLGTNNISARIVIT